MSEDADPTENPPEINIAECSGATSDNLSFTWDLVPPSGATNYTFSLYASDSSGCPPASSAKNYTIGQNLDQTTNSYPPTGSSVAVHTVISNIGKGCSTSGTIYFCVQMYDASGTAVTGGGAVAQLPIDADVPTAPTAVSASSGDSALDVSWTETGATATGDGGAAAGAAASYEVYAWPVGGTQPAVGSPSATTTEPAHTARVTGLTNEQEYNVVVYALSSAGNRSAASETATGTPHAVDDFWKSYQRAGGREAGGCGSGGAGLLALGALALVLFAVRRRKAGALVAFLALSLPGAARADSGRDGSVDLRLSGYYPSIDKEFGGKATPYRDAFGTDRGWMLRLNVDRILWDGFGTLEAGVGFGYFEKYGKGRFQSGAVSNDNTGFLLIPLSVSVYYRFDWAARKYDIPLVPYGRASLERYNWRVTNGSSDVSSIGGRSGQGATNGYSFTGGFAFLLNFFDQDMARQMDQDTGVNETYLFVDFTRSYIDDFGDKHSWNLSDQRATMAAGLLFVF